MRAARAAVEASGHVFGIRIEAPEEIERARAAGRTDDLLRHWVAANSLHAIDLLRHFGGEVRTRHLLRRTDPRFTETSIGALLEFKSGAIGQYTAHWGSPGRWSASLYGRGVSAVLTPFERGVFQYADRTEHAIPVDEVDVQFRPGFYRQLEAFVSRLRTGSTHAAPAADLADAARSMELAEWLSGGVH
jgi:predicted dehydrogenase